VLLLILCTTAKLAPYQTFKPTQKPSSIQAFFDGEEVRKDLSKATVTPVVLFVGAIALLLLAQQEPIRLPVALTSPPAFRGFDPDFCFRPPPAR
jgi:hypothetical protein